MFHNVVLRLKEVSCVKLWKQTFTIYRPVSIHSLCPHNNLLIVLQGHKDMPPHKSNQASHMYLALYPFMCSACSSVLTQPTPLNWAVSILWYQSLASLNTSLGIWIIFPFINGSVQMLGTNPLFALRLFLWRLLAEVKSLNQKGEDIIYFLSHVARQKI